MDLFTKKIGPNRVVTITYQLEIEGRDTPEWFARPMRVNFLYGRDSLMPLIEETLVGRSEGDELVVTIPPEQAYGNYDERLVQEIPLSQIKHPEMIKEGEYYQEITPSGRQVMFLVKEILDDHRILADFNHPAAGHNIKMKIKVEEVREATSFDYMSCDARNCGSG